MEDYWLRTWNNRRVYMTREEFIKKLDEKIKLIRNEKGYTQDKMAEMLGITKKTLIQVEKGRGTLGWSTTVAACVIFKDSEILQMTFGGGTEEIILSLAYDNYERKNEWTMGGILWWTEVKSNSKYKIQQNVISKHYRILDENHRRVCYSFDIEYINRRFEELNR
jgi:DNA-binding XRE family transcriptional regulator